MTPSTSKATTPTSSKKKQPQQPKKKSQPQTEPQPQPQSQSQSQKQEGQTGKQPQPKTPKRKRTPSSSSSSGRKKKTANSTKSEPTTPPPLVNHPPSSVLIIDNGGDSVKYGWSTDETPRSVPNLTARLAHQFTILVGDELDRIQNPSSLIGLTRSTERGVISNLGNQTQVWKRVLDLLGVMIVPNSEAANSLGWKVTSRAGVSSPPKTIPAHSIAVFLLLPPFCPRLLLDQIIYVWMEDFGVSYVGLGVSSAFASEPDVATQCSCTVDLGWSSSLVVPTFRQKLIDPTSIRRMPIGGRHLINMLKYYMSYRQYNLMDQVTILRDVFEKLSYLSMDFQRELRIARYKSMGRRPFDRHYVLPDYQSTYEGEVRLPPALQKELEEMAKQKNAVEGDEEEEYEDEDDGDFEDEEEKSDSDDDNSAGNMDKTGADDESKGNAGNDDDDDDAANDDGDGEDDDEDDEEETEQQKRKRILKERAEEERRRREKEEEEQILQVSVERFAIPEVLFYPRDAGLPADLVGLAQAIQQSVQACPMQYHPALYKNLWLTGGLSQLPNLEKRLYAELRKLVPIEYQLNITASTNPVAQAWVGAKKWVQDHSYTNWSVSKTEWDRVGKRKAYGSLLHSEQGLYV